jgi:UDP-N-acetylmuramoyl-tripeptide--D-alanyl-D-alanine ligase
MENIATAQYEVVEALPPDGAAFFNGDDPVVRDMATRGYPQTRQVVTQHGVPGARLEAINVQMTAEGLVFDVRDTATGEQYTLRAPLYGEHNVTNILMAAAVARYLGMSFPEIAMRVATLEPAEHRLHRQVMRDGTVIIDDAYSANPVGTRTALQVLALQNNKPESRRIVLSAGMFELGALQDAENRKLGERIADVATDVILIGPAQTKPVQEGLASKHFPADHLHVVNSLTEATSIYKSLLRSGDALLVLTDLPDVYA